MTSRRVRARPLRPFATRRARPRRMSRPGSATEARTSWCGTLRTHGLRGCESRTRKTRCDGRSTTSVAAQTSERCSMLSARKRENGTSESTGSTRVRPRRSARGNAESDELGSRSVSGNGHASASGNAAVAMLTCPTRGGAGLRSARRATTATTSACGNRPTRRRATEHLTRRRRRSQSPPSIEPLLPSTRHASSPSRCSLGRRPSR